MVMGLPSQPKPAAFDIPRPAVARHPGVMLSARELRRWMDGLPLGNPPKAAQTLLQQLRLLVRDPQPGGRLAGLLQVYEGPLERLLEVVDERLQGNTTHVVPLDQLEYALVDLLSELAFGHLRVANELLACGKTPTAKGLYRAMQLLDTAMTVQRAHYCRPAAEGWRRFVQIYRHAEAQRMARQPVDRALPRANGPATIEGLFFRALIIGLCDPHHHRADEVLGWQDWVSAHTDLVELGVLPQGPSAVPVDLSGELAPLTAARRGKPAPEMHYLGTERLLQRLQEDTTAPAGLGAALTGLLRGRKAPEQRQGPRQPRHHPFRMIYGLHNIHARLDALTRGRGDGDAPPAAVACRQVNQSGSGAAFHLRGPLNPPLSVGEPILFEAETRAGNGAVVGFAGRIQRVVMLEDQAIEIGVEKLQGRLIPLVITGSAAERLRGSTHALLQQAVDSGQQTLLATRFLYREGGTLTAESATADHDLRMTRLLGVVQNTAFISVEATDP